MTVIVSSNGLVFTTLTYLRTALFWGKSLEKKLHRFILALSCILIRFEAVQGGDFETALRLYTLAAEQGYVNAQ